MTLSGPESIAYSNNFLLQLLKLLGWNWSTDEHYIQSLYTWCSFCRLFLIFMLYSFTKLCHFYTTLHINLRIRCIFIKLQHNQFSCLNVTDGQTDQHCYNRICGSAVGFTAILCYWGMMILKYKKYINIGMKIWRIFIRYISYLNIIMCDRHNKFYR